MCISRSTIPYSDSIWVLSSAQQMGGIADEFGLLPLFAGFAECRTAGEPDTCPVCRMPWVADTAVSQNESQSAPVATTGIVDHPVAPKNCSHSYAQLISSARLERMAFLWNLICIIRDLIYLLMLTLYPS